MKISETEGRAKPAVLTPATTWREYELVSTYPVEVHDIQATLAHCWLGPERSSFLVGTSTRYRTAMTAVSNAAKFLAIISWYTSWRNAAIIPVLIGCIPRFVCTLMLLSVPILKLLYREFEFWFATTLNVVSTLVFSIELGLNLSLGYAFLTFLSIQVTILSDADIFTPSDTARAGILSCASTVALGIFALKRSADVAVLHPSAQNVWRLAALNLLSNVAVTLAIFIINKTFKRRSVFTRGAPSFVPLTVCRTQLTLQHRDPRPHHSTLPRVVSASHIQVHQLGRVASTASASPSHGGVSNTTQTTQLLIQAQPQDIPFVDSRNTLLPRLCIRQRLGHAQSAVLNACGVLGFGLAGIPLLLLFVFDVREPLVLYPCAIISITCTIPFCLVHAAHYQCDILRLLLHNFDFWFLTFQFASAKICIADLLDWDYRCLCILTWSPWFNWVLMTDAMVSIHARMLCFRKFFASLVLLTVLFGILAITYSLTLDPRTVLHDHDTKLSFLAKVVTLRISTKTVLAYRLATIWFWTVRLVSRLAKYPEGKLMFLRGVVEYQNPVFMGGVLPAEVGTRAKS